MPANYEEKTSMKVLNFLQAVDFSKFGVKVRRCVKKLKTIET